MRILLLIFLLMLAGWLSLPWLQQHLPPGWNPFTPLAVTDPPGWLTRYKVKRLADDPVACLAVMRQAQQSGKVQFTEVAGIQGACPVAQPLRITGFGDVTLSSSFLASCSLAVVSTMYVWQSQAQLQQAGMRSPLQRITHVGSYACRNIYHRQQGRLSEHATADAWDITGYQLTNGRWLRVENNWQQPQDASVALHALWRNGCANFGNALGPDYNAAHASHFHFGMRGSGYCR
ncbi:extensin family protein [Pantoea sp. At-9b]|uniref:extensin-like domain-containing protein n=1 Tax=Pantoea sp. (strain At-9b) TaxID=592316 RepID=UPI0001B401C0|nr:extensin family protein [Pantoea sp. At-9b]ADU68720.1 Extensin family protein [Pantoea sp. At-9b]